MAFAKGEIAMFNGTKLGIIRHTGNIWAAYVGNKKTRRLEIKERGSQAYFRRDRYAGQAILGKT